MVFSSPTFLFLFLPICIVMVLTASALDKSLFKEKPVLQNLTLLAFSIVFYLYGSGRQLVLLLGVILFSYICGLLIRYTRFRKSSLTASVIVQASVLGYFKYANFFVGQVSVGREYLGFPPIAWEAVLLPIGVSFFVFQAISYTIDVYREECEPLTNPLDVALYISMFPQLIAGPIVRYAEISDHLRARTTTHSDVARGACRFLLGVCKKVIVADAVGEVADAAFGLPNAELTSAAAIIGTFAYTFQIYFDFSAYSDMAIGLGRIFGFRFPENFDRPLSATSITDFWRRWHMTLSFWFRDYVYVPLGGSRTSKFGTYRNLWAVFLLSGLWHGANWIFIIWGAYHGFLLTLERMWRVSGRKRLSANARRCTTFLLVVIGFTIFRTETVEQSLYFYSHMFAPRDWSLPLAFAQHLTFRNMVLFVCAASSVLLPGTFVTGRWLEQDRSGKWVTLARITVMTLGAIYAAILMSSSNFSPFIYFRF